MNGQNGARSSRLLVVEDDRAIADAVVRRLRSEGYTVDVVFDGLSAVDAACAVHYDAVVLDVMLPGLGGHDVCRQIQAERPVPVLMLTARDEEADRLIGLSVGADDYLAKPFSPRELVARIAALLRRVERAALLTQGQAGRPPPSSPVTVGGLIVDAGTRLVSLHGEAIHLTRTEFDLLFALARREGRVAERDRLLAEVWDWEPAAARAVTTGATRVMDSHVKALRRKLGPGRIRTVHGVGYALGSGS